MSSAVFCREYRNITKAAVPSISFVYLVCFVVVFLA
jgi:hypothetical protein